MCWKQACAHCHVGSCALCVTMKTQMHLLGQLGRCAHDETAARCFHNKRRQLPDWLESEPTCQEAVWLRMRAHGLARQVCARSRGQPRTTRQLSLGALLFVGTEDHGHDGCVLPAQPGQSCATTTANPSCATHAAQHASSFIPQPVPTITYQYQAKSCPGTSKLHALSLTIALPSYPHPEVPRIKSQRQHERSSLAMLNSPGLANLPAV